MESFVSLNLTNRSIGPVSVEYQMGHDFLNKKIEIKVPFGVL